MGKNLLIFCCLILAVMLTGCSNNKKKTEQFDERGLPIFSFDNEDSIAVRKLGDEYVARFSSKNFDAAADMLYTVRNDSVRPLSDSSRAGFVEAMKHIPMQGCAIKEQTLRSDKDNQMRIAILMTPNGDLETERGTVNFFLNPVYIDGQWYLTLLDSYAEGVGLYH